ncbi:MAG TPA: TonB family protein [Terriglobales bacterium]|nr:TonB family protein [Terriglobales bacterium]
MIDQTFRSYVERNDTPRPWGVALSASLLLYLAAAALVVAVAARATRPTPERQVEIAFIESVAKPAPAPTAPPAMIAPPAPAPAAAPVVLPRAQLRRVEKPPPARELVAPRHLPKEPPKEVEASADAGVVVTGEPAVADPAGLEGGSSPGIAGGKVGVVELPSGATPPVALASNRQPRYPRQARRSGKTGMVVLKVVIQADGGVGEISVESGEQPFVEAAIGAVKEWRYRPALYQGVAISVYRIVRIRFELDD